MEQQSLKGKIAVVTGGSSGIGAAAVRLLAAEGATVYVGYNKGLDRAEKLIAELPGSGHQPIHIVLEDSSTIRAAAKAVGDAHGRADIVVNSAGFTKPVPHGDLDSLSDELIDSLMIANVSPKLLYLKLVSAAALDPDFRSRMERWKCASGTFRMNVALTELPDFSCLPGVHAQPHHSSGIIFAPTLAYMERAYHDALMDLAAPAMGHPPLVRVTALAGDGPAAYVRAGAFLPRGRD